MIAVTGGNGFLGRHILRALEEQNANFIALLRTPVPSETIPEKYQRQVDFNNFESLKQTLWGATQLLHIAGRVNGSIQDLKEANPLLMRRLVEVSSSVGIRRIIYISTVAAQMRKGPYGQTKWEAEEILKSSGIPYLIFRCSLIYGQGDKKNLAMIERTLKTLPFVPLLGGGKFLLQPVYVEDVVRVILKAAEGDMINRTYNLAGARQIPLRDMVQVLGERLGKRPRMIPIPLKPVQSLVRIWSSLFPRTRLPVKQIMELDQHRAFEIEEARRDFGFNPRSFREGIRAMSSDPLCVG